MGESVVSPDGGQRWWRAIPGVLERVAALFVAFVLLKSSLAHLANPYQFLSAIYSYEMVGPTTGPWIAMLVPFLQMSIAIAVLLRLYPLEAYLLGSFLFAGFVAVQTSAIRRGLNIECGCFGGIGGDVVGPQTIAVAEFGLVACVCGFLLTGFRQVLGGSVTSSGSTS